jgi:coenzyme F420-0:L-glutamate ligase / coenzyme F420-1:gamma-L-glutamate ligase
MEFWDVLDQLLKESRLVIDRPKGSHHPNFHEVIYPFDYGYLEGTTAADGGGIDVWVGSIVSPEFDAIVVTGELNERDVEIKILLGCTEAEKETILRFHDASTMGGILVRRGDSERNITLAILRSRRSVRRFLPKPVARELLGQIIETAIYAPSAHNRQPWRFVVMEGGEARIKLVESMGASFRGDLLADGVPAEEAEVQVRRSRQRILEAPACILLCLERSVEDHYPDARRGQAEHLMGVQSVAMAGENLLLAAHAEGLGAVWLCAPLFAQEVVCQALDLPQTWQAQGLVLMGYAQKTPPWRSRHSISDVTIYR